MKEVLIYGSIYTFSAEAFIQAINEVGEEGLTTRVNCRGGDVMAGFGMIAKYAEYKGPKKIKVDGCAYSMALFMLAYAEDVEALDVSEFLIHRAAYPEWIERDPEIMTADMWANLDRMNKSLRTAFENKIGAEGVAEFERLKGVKLKDIFSNEGRKDVTFSAAEAKKIGLINRIEKITPAKKSAISADMQRIAAEAMALGYNVAAPAPTPAPVSEVPVSTPKKEILKPRHMTLEQLKAEHPAIFDAAVKIGVEKENERVKAFLEFQDVDAAGVKKGIIEGKDLTPSQMAEFGRKMFSAAALDATKKGAPGAVTTEEQPEGGEAGAKAKKSAEYLADIKNHIPKN